MVCTSKTRCHGGRTQVGRVFEVAVTLVTLHCIGQLASAWYLGYASVLHRPSQELNFETERVSFLYLVAVFVQFPTTYFWTLQQSLHNPTVRQLVTRWNYELLIRAPSTHHFNSVSTLVQNACHVRFFCLLVYINRQNIRNPLSWIFQFCFRFITPFPYMISSTPSIRV